MILEQLQEAINEFLIRGNKIEDTIIKMGAEFYDEFVESCQSQMNITIKEISYFMGIPVTETNYLKANQCLLINYKRILENGNDNNKLNMVILEKLKYH